jgi:hypothetical protein
MVRFLLPAALAVALLTGSAEAQTMGVKAGDRCASLHVSGDQFTNAANPAAFAEAWSQSLTRFALAIPVLSPNEERWLRDEQSAGVERWTRSLKSREYAQLRTLRYAQSLAISMRNIIAERDQSALIGKWLAFVDEVFAWGDNEFLAIAIERHAISTDVLPSSWIGFAGILDGETAYSGIDRGQRALVQSIVRCTLPALGVGARADASPAVVR